MAVLVCGLVATGAAAALSPREPVATGEAGLLFAAAVLSIWLPLRIERRGTTQGFTLEEGIFVAMLFALPVGVAALLAPAAALVAHSVRRPGWVKVAFNVGQVALWSAAATATFGLIGAGSEVLAGRSLVAVGVAMLAANAVSLSALAGLFQRLNGRPFWATVTATWRLNVATAVGNTSFGLVLAIVIGVDARAAVLASSLMIGLYLGYRGYAHMLQERGRQDQLHAITQALTDIPSSGDPGAFLTGLRELFGAARSGVLLAGQEATWSDDARLWQGSPSGDVLVEALDGGRLVKRGENTESLAAAVSYEGQVLGAIAVYERVGLEPWDSGDLTLLSAVANEAAVALRNVELFEQVEKERAKWEAESSKLGDIVNAATDGIAMLSSEGLIEAWNDAMVTITGLPSDQAVGQPWYVPLRVRDSDGIELLPSRENVFTQSVRGRRYSDPVEVQVLRRDGVWRYLRATFAPIHREDTHPAGTVMVARDVTAEREVEGLKADFVATVSHELRTPLTPLRGFLQTLATHRDELGEDQLDTIYSSMDSQLGRLERLIADLLVVADLDSGTTELNRDPVDLLGTAAVAVANEASSDTERVAVSGQDGVVVLGDRKAMVRIIRSLVSNALKHTDAAVEVVVEADGVEGVLSVIDDGPGIAPWEQKEIFQRFRRLGDHLTRNQGPGLGLPIASALAERLNGKVSVESDVGEGSTFTLRLPLARPRLVERSEGPQDGVSRAS